MRTAALTSPVGQYKAQVLLLAPEESPDDANLKSLVSQLLELGIPFELDENWRVPTAPPKDLSAYKICLFPETAKAKYDQDLDAFYSHGGYLLWDKYYPIAAQTSQAGFTGGTAAYLYGAWGRDLYFWSVANMLMEGGVTLDDPDFRSTFERRSVTSILDEGRESFFARCKRSQGPWRSWGDTTYAIFLSQLALAKRLDDPTYLGMVDDCWRRLCDSVPEALAQPLKYQEIQIKGAANNSFDLTGHLLMKRGTEINDSRMIEAGVQAARYFAENVFDECGGKLNDRRGTLLYGGETMGGLPALYWLTRCTGEQKYSKLGDRLLDTICSETLHADGLWHHWADLKTGRKGNFWSRMTTWPLMIFSEVLEGLEPNHPTAVSLREKIEVTFQALLKYQDPDWGIWHLVVDEPESRIESSVAAFFLYAHHQLRKAGLIDHRYDEAARRAFAGLKRLHYRAGLTASCRGTACGVPNYYRSRPMGYSDANLFPAAIAEQMKQETL